MDIAPPGHTHANPDRYRIAICDAASSDYIEAMWFFDPPAPTPSIESLYAHLGEEQP